jgi:N-acetylmuramic acid 6-phosphate (MurNAc-6-P) etherase
MSQILKLMGLKPSPQSVDYVENKKQFHLYNLLTEQRHPNTWNLSTAIQSDTETGLSMLLSVDRDVTLKLAELARDPAVLEQAIQAVAEAIRDGRKIYVYGCGATGRLAKQMESSFWRPFWTGVKGRPCRETLRAHLPPDIEARLIGEMTGADRALVSSLEGFEDLQLIGRLQLEDRGISRGDVVVCVTEGGETSSVIGTILGALDQYGPLTPALLQEARRRLYFVYNNPDDVLRPFTRSAAVLDNPAVTRINLATGPQAITGSTRLQATTSETFVVGAVLEEALARVLREHLTDRDMRQLGFCRPPGIAQRLADFEDVKAAVDSVLPAMAWLTDLESRTYRQGHFATYFAKEALITVFIDNTERSPTFRLYPLDQVQDRERRCWLQVWTEAADLKDAWRRFLGRPFRGLESSFYRRAFETQVEDPYLREAALRSLANAGDDQELSYDFSFSAANIERRGPRVGDLGVAVLVDREFMDLARRDSAFERFVRLHHENGARVALILVTGRDLADAAKAATQALGSEDVLVHMALDVEEDPLGLRRQIALKMLLNAHSTGIMAALGRVIGNTMTNVSPSNLKLIGRATFLIRSHVNDVIAQPHWVAARGSTEQVSFAEANAVLFDAMEYVRAKEMGQTAEVALSIIRMLETLRRRAGMTWEEARAILDGEGLAAYLQRMVSTHGDRGE